jgi:hypothetical protein
MDKNLIGILLILTLTTVCIISAIIVINKKLSHKIIMHKHTKLLLSFINLITGALFIFILHITILKILIFICYLFLSILYFYKWMKI